MLTASFGCSPSTAECERSADCPPGEFCVQAGGVLVSGGRCVAPAVADAADIGTDGHSDASDAPDVADGRDESDGDTSDTSCSPRPERCNGVDDDCDGDLDEARPCSKGQGVCAGAMRRCNENTGTYESCREAYGSAYESDETLADGRDNDCDGLVDEVFAGVEVSKKNEPVCARHIDGDISCIAAGTTDPFDVAFPIRGDYRAVTTGSTHACALAQTDQIDCWGGVSGQNLEIADPPSGSYDNVDAGRRATCAVSSMDRNVECWGVTSESRSDEKFITVSFGKSACGTYGPGTAICWGNSTTSKLEGDVPNAEFVSVDIASQHACGLTKSGRVRCWGRDPPPDPMRDFEQVAVGDPFEAGTGNRKLYACGLSPDGGIHCWGASAEVPGAPPGPNRRFLDLSVSKNGGCAVAKDHTIECWGVPEFSP